MIQFQSITLSRGQQTLIEDSTVTVPMYARVGLIGSNGSGKSTLFSLINGLLETEAGEVRIPRNVQISHVSQEVPISDQKAIDFVLDGHEPYRKIEKKLTDAEIAGDFDKVVMLYPEWEQVEGDKIPSNARRILHGLGFTHTQMDAPLTSFSGGWRVRLQLARTLLHPGELLLLDEPTNHLDLEAILWLEKWCKSYTGTLVIIAHDIAFLDNVVDHIIHLEHKKLKFYKGNYSTFNKTRAEQMALDQACFEKQKKKKEHLEKFINRFKAKASKAKQAQSRVKQLAKMETIALVHASSPIQFQFPEVEMVNPLVRIVKANIGYGKKVLLDNVGFYLGPQDRVALLGKNGQGKSTFVKVLSGELPIMSGEFQSANKLRIGYFAQHQVESLDLTKSAMALMQDIAPRSTEQQLRDYLGSYQFRHDKVFLSVGELSGGERARLTFAMLVWQKPQVILLDEPTNHLDIEMREALALALQEFNGALVVVSHDRAFIDACCDQLYLVHDGKVDPFDGSLDDYVQWSFQESKMQDNAKAKPVQKKVSEEDQQKRKKLQNQVKKLEVEVDKLTKSLQEIEKLLLDPGLYTEDNKRKLKDILLQKETQTRHLVQIEAEWSDAVDELESE